MASESASGSMVNGVAAKVGTAQVCLHLKGEVLGAQVQVTPLDVVGHSCTPYLLHNNSAQPLCETIDTYPLS